MARTQTLDAKGLKCPIPVLKARRAMKELQAGDVLEVHATDPGSMADFEHFCQTTGHKLLEAGGFGGVYVFRIEKTV